MESPLRLGPLTLRTAVVSALENNCYLLTHTGTGAQVLIDAADDVSALRALIERGESDVDQGVVPRLSAILTTHSHWDHTRALERLKSSTGAATGCGAADSHDINVPMDFTLDHGDVTHFDGFDLEAVSLRGHTPGSIAYVLDLPDVPVQIFAGDSLFSGGVGATKNKQAFHTLIHDVTARVFDRFGDDAVVWPGHGDPTTLGAERPSLDTWRERGW